MFNQTKLFQFQRNCQQQYSRNKENNLSFRNVAANNLLHTQSQVNINKVDKSFKSIHNQSQSFYHSGQNLQQELYYLGSCYQHPNKHAQYVQTISQLQYCKQCAVRRASLGNRIQKSQNIIQRKMTPLFYNLGRDEQNKQFVQINDQSEIKMRPHNSFSSNHHMPVNFSTLISQKTKRQSIQAKYEESQKIIDQYVEIYSQKMEQIQQLLNDIKIKDTLYIKRLKSQNASIYWEAKNQRIQAEKSNYDLFGRSIIRGNFQQKVKFNLPTQERVEMLGNILQYLEQLKSASGSSISANKIPLIKSINSNESDNNTKNFLLKNSSSVSNLSSKSNFKKQKKHHQLPQKFASEFNPKKNQKQQQAIQSSRFSSTSAIIRKKSHKLENQNKTESAQMKRKNTENSLGGSNSCEDTPESIKSRISANSFVLPKNVAVAMFQKINVCESIDIKPETNQPDKMRDHDKINENYDHELLRIQVKDQGQISFQSKSKSSYVNKSNNKSITVTSNGRKSFNRYQNFDNQQ